MGYNTSGKHSWLGHKDHNALLDVAADHGMLLSLAPFFCSFVGRFLQMDHEPKDTRKRKFCDKNAAPISFNAASRNL